MTHESHQQLDERLRGLKSLNAVINVLIAEQETLRKEIFGIIENDGLTDGYKERHRNG